jgi:serine/threonine-protein kinase
MIQLGLLQRGRARQAPSSIPGTDQASLGQTAQDLARRLDDRFEVRAPLAIGGMAVLFSVCHRIHGGLFAAKVLHRHLQGRAEMVEAFRREALHLARLAGHPNLIPVFDSHFDGGLSFQLYPFVEGEDLDRILERAPLAKEEALHMTAQLSSVLCHMESHGIVHCDISPGNIRIDTFGRYRLLDLGLSRDTAEPIATPAGGTPLYTSPELLEGALPDPRSDLYALGLVLAEALTGCHLIEGDSPEAIRRCHCEATWRLPEAIQADAAVAQLLERLLARDPARRIGSAFELSARLAALGYERPEFRAFATQHPRPSSSVRRARLAPIGEGRST